MITVETRPQRATAMQWQQPGDATALGEHAYRHGTEVRYGVHSPIGLMRLAPGDWIVLINGSAHVCTPAEFHHKFKIVEEAGQ